MNKRSTRWSCLTVMAVAFIVSGASYAFAARYYVKPEGNDSRTGKSWEEAFLTINKATAVSVSGDEVWVAAGTYVIPETITIKSGVSLFGGFAGTETDISQRDSNTNAAIIDGGDVCRCVNNNGHLDGFHVTRGYSDDGGGVFNRGTISRCNIYSNSASAGGGIYGIYGSVNDSSIFLNNANNGGGINDHYGMLTNCSIYENNAKNSGGGINANDCITTGCRIYKNSAYLYGGGIYHVLGTIENCYIYQNSVISPEARGAGVYIRMGVLTGSVVCENIAMVVSSSDATVKTNRLAGDWAQK